MKEIEIKFKVHSTQSVLEQLVKRGCTFEEPMTQEDFIYIPNEVTQVPVLPGVNVLRLRKQGAKYIFTLKQSTKEHHLSKIEKETEVSNPENLLSIFTLLGYKQAAHVVKTRRVCKIDGYEICVDQVQDLGEFIEMEKITDEDPVIVRENMEKVIKDLGIELLEQMHVGYDILFMEKFHTLET